MRNFYPYTNCANISLKHQVDEKRSTVMDLKLYVNTGTSYGRIKTSQGAWSSMNVAWSHQNKAESVIAWDAV